jgi:hypothetical protein
MAGTVRGFVVLRACRRAGTDDAAAKQRRRRRASGPALLGGADGPRSGPLEPVEKLLTSLSQDFSGLLRTLVQSGLMLDTRFPPDA